MSTKPVNKPKKTGTRGGKRPGAGRKTGSKNVITEAIRQKLAQTGLTPLEVMHRAMWEFVDAAEKIPLGDAKVIDGKVVTRLNLLERATEIAAKAAPYSHSKLQTIEHTGKDGGPIKSEVTLTAEESYLRMVKGR